MLSRGGAQSVTSPCHGRVSCSSRSAASALYDVLHICQETCSMPFNSGRKCIVRHAGVIWYGTVCLARFPPLTRDRPLRACASGNIIDQLSFMCEVHCVKCGGHLVSRSTVPSASRPRSPRAPIQHCVLMGALIHEDCVGPRFRRRGAVGNADRQEILHQCKLVVLFLLSYCLFRSARLRPTHVLPQTFCACILFAGRVAYFQAGA
jgi:hypothetical protein